MGRVERRRTGSFVVEDDRGRRYQVEEFSVFEYGRIIGSNEPVVRDIEYQLPNGERLEGLLGGEQFMHRGSGTAFRKV